MVRTVQPMKSLEFCVTSFAVPCTVSRMFPPTFAKEIEVEAHAQAASEHVTWSQSLVPGSSPSTARRIDMAMDQYLYIPFLGGYSHPFTSYFDVHQGDRVLTHPHMTIVGLIYHNFLILLKDLGGSNTFYILVSSCFGWFMLTSTLWGWSRLATILVLDATCWTQWPENFRWKTPGRKPTDDPVPGKASPSWGMKVAPRMRSWRRDPDIFRWSNRQSCAICWSFAVDMFYPMVN